MTSNDEPSTAANETPGRKGYRRSHEYGLVEIGRRLAQVRLAPLGACHNDQTEQLAVNEAVASPVKIAARHRDHAGEVEPHRMWKTRATSTALLSCHTSAGIHERRPWSRNRLV